LQIAACTAAVAPTPASERRNFNHHPFLIAKYNAIATSLKISILYYKNSRQKIQVIQQTMWVLKSQLSPMTSWSSYSSGVVGHPSPCEDLILAPSVRPKDVCLVLAQLGSC
jgi:hypothetical protein